MEAFLLAFAMVLFACGGDDDDGDGATQTFSCVATISPITIEYVVSGNLLEVSANGQTDTWERVAAGNPGRPVYGTWHIGEQTTPGAGTVSVDALIEPDEVSSLADCDFGTLSVSARATSAAEITDTTIAILEADEDVQVITR